MDNFVRGNTKLPGDSAAFLRDLNEQLREVLQDVRRFGQDLRPPMLDDLGLLATLRWLVSELKEQHGIETDLRVLGIERRLSPEAEFTLFRIVQEALRNIEKHAETSKAEVEIEFGQGKTRISVSDNGKGFELSGSFVDLARAGKLGLAGMEERTRLLGGSMRIESEPGKGTTVIVEVPI
ncbi:Signal transduction histidine-protein kinase/phosphatase DegS [subsurface metagenome]